MDENQELNLEKKSNKTEDDSDNKDKYNNSHHDQDVKVVNHKNINLKLEKEIIHKSSHNRITDVSQIDCSDPMKLLDQAHGAYIKQKLEMYEIVTGCETKNRYSICLRLNNWNKLYKAFKCKEESSWFMRNCCPGESREFKMMVKYSPNGINDKVDDYSSQLFAELGRPYKCTCFGMGRPELNVKLSKGNKEIGKISEPFSCSRVIVNTTDEKGDMVYKFDIDRTQPGISCRAFTCGAIESVDFPIQNVKLGDNVIDGEIKRMGRSYDEAVIGSDADCYDIVFPKKATAEEKFLILSSTLLIDFRYFEDTEEEENTTRKRSYYAK